MQSALRRQQLQVHFHDFGHRSATSLTCMLGSNLACGCPDGIVWRHIHVRLTPQSPTPHQVITHRQYAQLRYCRRRGGSAQRLAVARLTPVKARFQLRAFKHARLKMRRRAQHGLCDHLQHTCVAVSCSMRRGSVVLHIQAWVSAERTSAGSITCQMQQVAAWPALITVIGSPGRQLHDFLMTACQRICEHSGTIPNISYCNDRVCSKPKCLHNHLPGSTAVICNL